ncbi:hypothetical protein YASMINEVIRUS_71 [Yasminevirus sp. GU-2018]|uniref:Uncharacterized protein n=1 Tax=Yasminevirus sp. GU-2018 TaxID=2420051 RepID=A0A5K0U6Q2_9VIRU|nr:hypothetical protein YASMINEVIRUS_71 [Yasminevirus sp. GU-2018]
MQRATDSLVLRAIQENNLIFVSAQPDNTYFHWQVEIYLYQFEKHGIIDRCYALFGYTGQTPSAYAQRLAKKYPHVLFYKDTRTSNDYSPSIRPHLFAKFFKEYPHFGKNVFCHDSDIFLTKLPRFDLMLQPGDDVSYLSDTISYIGYEYIRDCSIRYKSKHKSLPDLDIFYGMCKAVGISPELVIANQPNSGGAQYLLKNIDHTYWEENERKCDELYSYLCKYEKTYPINHHIQKWTAGMWVDIWLLWKRGGKTKIHKELDFSWATGTVDEYNHYNIFHLAGITGSNCSDKFHKGKFTSETVFDAYINNSALFDHISRTNATYLYTNVIRDYVKNVYAPEKGIKLSPITFSPMTKSSVIQDNNVKRDLSSGLISGTDNAFVDVKRFILSTRGVCGGTYIRDDNKQCVGKSVWRSENGAYIIFWSGTHWIITYSRCEKEIGPKCGGLLSTTSKVPYTTDWNRSDIKITIL